MSKSIKVAITAVCAVLTITICVIGFIIPLFTGRWENNPLMRALDEADDWSTRAMNQPVTIESGGVRWLGFDDWAPIGGDPNYWFSAWLDVNNSGAEAVISFMGYFHLEPYRKLGDSEMYGQFHIIFIDDEGYTTIPIGERIIIDKRALLRRNGGRQIGLLRDSEDVVRFYINGRLWCVDKEQSERHLWSGG